MNEWEERLLETRGPGLVARLEQMLRELLGEDTEEKWASWQVRLFRYFDIKGPQQWFAGVKAGLASAKVACVEHAALCTKEISREKVSQSLEEN